jgi:hypothetical protein
MLISLEKDPPRSPVHMVWGILAIGAVIAGAFVRNNFDILPGCLFRKATGIPCLTCGGTRSLAALSELDLAASFGYNPLATLTVAAMVIFSLAVASGLIFQRRLVIKPTSTEAIVLRWSLAAAIILDWLYLIFFLLD